MIITKVPLRECKIIVPEVSYGTESYKFEEIRWFEGRLLSLWGGFTALSGAGGWRTQGTGGKTEDVVEPVVVYFVAVPPDDYSKAQLKLLAQDAKLKFNQECIYVVHWDGEVELVY